MARSNINRVVLTGNLTTDPDLRSLPSGTAVCKLRIASNTLRKDGTTGDWVEKQGDRCRHGRVPRDPGRDRGPAGPDADEQAHERRHSFLRAYAW
jgi:Single-strand binding protein family